MHDSRFKLGFQLNYGLQYPNCPNTFSFAFPQITNSNFSQKNLDSALGIWYIYGHSGTAPFQTSIGLTYKIDPNLMGNDFCIYDVACFDTLDEAQHLNNTDEDSFAVSVSFPIFRLIPTDQAMEKPYTYFRSLYLFLLVVN